MRRMIRGSTAGLLILASLTLTPLTQPETALAADASMSTCDEAAFDAALSAVQSSGGGTITFACAGAIVVTSEKVITSAVTIVGDGSVTFDGGGSARLFVVNSGASLALVGLTLQNGSAIAGGAIHNSGELSVTASTFSGNGADFGGAIYNDGGVLEITASTISGNSAYAEGYGGSIYNQNSGVLTVTTSTFTGISAGYDGGAIVNKGTLTITASTFSANSADHSGGAIDNYSFGTLTITASTFSGNSAGNGGAIFNSGTTRVSASIMVNSSSATGNCRGTIISQGSNISDDASCNFTASGDVQGSPSINLGPLQDNGGPTQTMLPQTGSAAIDTADCALSSAQDQRGASRPATGTTCDKGAVEVAGTFPIELNGVVNVSGTIAEGSEAEIQAFAYSPAGASLDDDFDCDDDGSYEHQGFGSGGTGYGYCGFLDNGAFDAGVRVCDAAYALNCATGSTDVTITNVAPAVDTPVVAPSPSDEGQSVSASATFSDPSLLDTHTCTVEYGAGSGPQPGTVANHTCTGPAHIYADDDDYPVTVEVCDDDGGCGQASLTHTVLNLPPVIDSITTNAPVPQGKPVIVTVIASDAGGANDPLTYEFDCDGNGTYDLGPQTANTASCPLDPSAASPTIHVAVSDDDGGLATGSITVGQTVTLCANGYTGALTGAMSTGGCPPNTRTLVLPQPQPTSLCVNRYTGQIIWLGGRACPATSYWTHVVPDDGPLAYCRSLSTGQLRYGSNGQCGTGGRAGVIPG